MRLPHSVQEIADVIGPDKALYLVAQLRRRCPGRTINIYVPKPEKIHDDHALVKILGMDDALALARVFRGAHIYPASCVGMRRVLAHRDILKLRDSGMGMEEVARELSVSTKWVQTVTDARNMIRRGDDIEVVAHACKISALALSQILDIKYRDIGVVRRRSPPRTPKSR